MVFEEECVLGCLETKMSSSFGVLREKKTSDWLIFRERIVVDIIFFREMVLLCLFVFFNLERSLNFMICRVSESRHVKLMCF